MIVAIRTRRSALERWLRLDLLVFVILLSLFLPFVNRVLDLHHQGLIFATAVSVSRGLSLYSEVWSQYGPLPTYIQAIALNLFGEKLLVLQVLSAVCSAASGTVSFHLFKKLYGNGVATISIGIWVLSAPFFLWPLLPWSSDFALLFFLIGLNWLLSVLETRSWFLAVIAGIALGLSFWCRLNTGALMIGSVIGFLLIDRRLWHAATTSLGILLIILGGLLFLELQHSLQQFWEQAVLWPFQWVADAKTGLPPLQSLGFGLLVPGLRGLALLLTVVLILQPNRVLRVIGLAGLIVILGISKFVETYTDNHPSYWTPLSSKWTLLGWSPISALWGLSVVGIIGSLVVTIAALCKSLDAISSITSVNRVLLVGAVSFLAGVYPVPDVIHLWWVVLPLLGPAIALIAQRIESNRRRKVVGLFAIVLLMPQAISSISYTFSVDDKTPWPNGSPLVSMHQSNSERAILQQNIELIEELQYQFGERPIFNLCIDAFWITLGSSAPQPDPFFFLWGPGKGGWTLPRDFLTLERSSWVKQAEPILFVCNPSVDANALTQLMGYNILLQTENVSYGGLYTIAVPKRWRLGAAT